MGRKFEVKQNGNLYKMISEKSEQEIVDYIYKISQYKTAKYLNRECSDGSPRTIDFLR
ncbi:MAG: hypothetical protein J5634_03645 [Bacilli bacterium]|nr:hypothetical protein [Bacilli bacterium]